MVGLAILGLATVLVVMPPTVATAQEQKSQEQRAQEQTTPERGAQEQTAPEQGSEEQPVEREVKAQAGRQVRVGTYFSLKRDCTPGQLPAIRLVENPANGAVVVRSGKVRATNVRQCLAVEVPAYIAFYRSKPDFSGTDTFLIELKAADGKVRHQRIRVVVQPSGAQRI
jgi:hypothetical protein